MRTIITIMLIMFALLAVGGAKAQEAKQRKLEVFASVSDHLTHEGIDSLRATLLRASDSTFIDTVRVQSYTSQDKRFTYIEATIHEAGDYLIRLEAKDYQTRFTPFSLAKLYKHETYHELKPIYLHRIKKALPLREGLGGSSDSTTVMDEVVVKATKLKFYMDGDTLVYDADAFSMAEGSMLDALIKKLPGVELHDGGEITVNGRKVDALLLNGKDFFDSDRELLLDNMPSYMVKDIRSYERTPDSARGTNREKTTQKEMVMDVRLKRDYNTAWLANAEAGAGLRFGSAEDFGDPTKAPPFLARAFAMRYSSNSRLALFANANNLSDYRTPGEKGEWSPLQQMEGLTTSYTLGANGLYEKSEGLRYQGSIKGTYSDINNANHTSGETFLEGGNTYGRSFFTRRSYDFRLNTDHRLHLRKRGTLWQALKQPYLDHGTQLEFLRWSNRAQSGSATLAEDVASQWGKAWMDSLMTPYAGDLLRRYALNRTTSRSKASGHYVNWQNHGYTGFSPAHNDHLGFWIPYSYRLTDRYEEGFEHYRLDYPRSAAAADLRNRFRPTTDRTHHVSFEPELSFSFGKDGNHAIELSNEFSYSYARRTADLYLLNQLTEWAEPELHPLGLLPSTEELLRTLDADNSQHSRTRLVTNTPALGYRLSISNDSLQTTNYLNATLLLPVSHETLDYWQGAQVDTTMSRRTASLSARIGFYHARAKSNRSLYASYYTDVTQPSMSSLLNIRTDSDPLNIQLGNPDLRPSRSHSIYGRYSEKLRRWLVNGSFQFSATQDAFATATLYDLSTGIRTRTPQNINGNWDTRASAGVDFPLDHKEHLRLKQSLAHRHSHSVDLVNESRSTVASNYLDEELSLSWKPTDKLDFSAKGDLHWQHSTSARADFLPINVFDFDYGLTAQAELPWNLQLATDLTMYSRRGYSDGAMNTNELVWNARLTKRMMKGNLLLQLDGFDLLGQLSNVRHSINAQGRTETFYNVIPSYGLLHLVWRYNKKPK